MFVALQVAGENDPIAMIPGLPEPKPGGGGKKRELIDYDERER